jgi:hypothetical protein
VTPAPAAPAVRRAPPTASQRIEAALARHEGPSAPRVELTVAPETRTPRTIPATVILATKPKKNTIRINDVTIASRMLALPETLRELEFAWVARRLARDCFGDANSPETVRLALEVTPETTRVETSEPKPTARAACVAKVLADQLEWSWHPTVRLRVAAHFVPGDELPAGAPRPSAAEIDEELRELQASVARSAEGAGQRSLPLLLLSGVRRLDASRLATSREARDAHLALARSSFEAALGAADAAPDARFAALYGLFTTLATMEKVEDAARVARALVCPSRYPSPSAPGALEQDHPARWWEAWENVHPASSWAKRPPARAVVGDGTSGPRTWDEETTYRSPYDGCATPAGVPARWRSEAWRTLGSYHAEQDVAAGPFADNRAASALRMALEAASGEDVAWHALALGRVLVHHQRFAEATRVLARAAPSSEPRERTNRAAQLLATALTYYDLEGPGELEPRSERPDIIDTQPSPKLAEEKLAVVLARVDLLPRSAALTPLVSYWAAWDLRQIQMSTLAVTLFERFLARYPDHRDAPLVAWELAETHRQRSAYHRPGTPEALEAARLSVEARMRLSRYAGHSSWTEANAGDAEARARATELARPSP